ncbi:MAG: hypothetical protein A2X35_11655 [Elusimicrobia bacterium GWA2_61_42]|nr:MAG: hypothetical protein A2X35_11655 [Elusimicrobia bacterium GWA2_61_42]OGR75810.1 MAG: hypothetical protein A2X38_07260 [Elusimicrobia bacterium GWC2_61_25]
MDWDSHRMEWEGWYGGGTQWREAGFTYAGAKQWYDTGVTAPSLAFAWEGIGFSPQQARAWSGTGCGIEAIKSMADIGISAAEARKWGGNCNPQYILVWRKVGIDPSEVDGWVQAKFSPDSAKAWHDLGFSAMGALSCTSNSYTLDDIKVLLDSKAVLSDIKSVCARLSKTEKAKWESKYDLAKMASLSEYFSFEEITALKKAGFSIDEAKNFRREGFSAEETLTWMKAGFTINEAKDYKVFGLSGAVAVKRGCPKGYGNIYALLSANPYEVEGKCFEFAGDTMQLINRTTGLFTQSQQVFYMDFGSDSLPNIGFHGIVKGMGVYEYTTRLGVAKKIPHLKKLLVLN